MTNDYGLRYHVGVLSSRISVVFSLADFFSFSS